MTKQEFDARLKQDAEQNRFTIEADNIVFDKKSNLEYQVLESFKLRELLTKHALSKTVLNKSLLFSLNDIRETLGFPVTIRASYASPEYHLTSFGAHDSELYTKGLALSLGIEASRLERLVNAVKEKFKGEIFIYPWGVHIGRASETTVKDYRNQTGIKTQVNNILTDHTMKNYILIGAAALAGWFFFIKK